MKHPEETEDLVPLEPRLKFRINPENNKKCVLFEKNSIPFGQDFCQKIGVPTGVYFHLHGGIEHRFRDNLVCLVGKGYGERGSGRRGDNYGNGAIFIPRKYFTDREIEILKKTLPGSVVRAMKILTRHERKR